MQRPAPRDRSRPSGRDYDSSRDLLTPLVSSVRTMFVNLMVIGGEHGGWSTATAVKEPSALPFWTGKSPAADTACLLPAWGSLLPGLTHWASAVSTTWTWDSLPRPASLNSAVKEASAWVADAETK